MPKKSKVTRDCSHCKHFALLGGRYGTCTVGEKPSAPIVCNEFHRDLEEI